MTDIVRSTRGPEPAGAYPHARRVGPFLFVSGIGPRKRGDNNIPGVTLDASGHMVDYDVEPQVRQVFENIRMILEEAGASFDRIVDVTSFLTNLERDFPAYNRVYAEYFPPGPNQPTRTTVGITSLPKMGNAPIAYEAKIIAYVGS